MRTTFFRSTVLVLALASGVTAANTPFSAAVAKARYGGELRFCIHADPKTFDPFLVYDEQSEAIRFLTGGTLLRLDRKTQQVVPRIASSWKILEHGRQIRFEIRPNVRFSDGSALQLDDVVFSLRTFFDPAKHAPDADSFGVETKSVKIAAVAPSSVVVTFPTTIAGLERLFDVVAIVSARAVSLTAKPIEMPVLGPFRIAEYRPGFSVTLARNADFWKTDADGLALPRLDTIRLYIQSNAALELLRFRQGETDLLNNVDPEMFSALSKVPGIQAFDLGPSLDSEQLWFNQSPNAPLPAFRKKWFQSRGFRTAVSLAINRADIARIAFFGRASPSAGPVSPTNQFWFNTQLSAPSLNNAEALKLLEKDGFHLSNQILRDGDGNPVEFSIVTNGGNATRARVAALIREDLAKIGMHINIVQFDFPALLQRITKTFDYESCLLGLVNSDLDPSGQMNVWLSSGSNHAWNPGQASPSTDWEREVDSLMAMQAVERVPARRKVAFDRVQAISREQNPALYLITKHVLTAYGSAVANPAPAVLFPQTYWNAEELYLRPGSPRGRARAGGSK